MPDRPFNTEGPIAFFITWTCYGTWLAGDERGWHQWGKGGTQPPDTPLKTAANARKKESTFLLSKEDRIVVEETINKHCEIRGWICYKVNARSNHIHVVVAAHEYAPEIVRDQFKAWCTRNLKAKHSARKRFWTEGASCRWINHEDDLESAIQYAGETQDHKYIEIQKRY